MPLNCGYIKCKWVLKNKYKCEYCNGLIACGYCQVPAVNFQKVLIGCEWYHIQHNIAQNDTLCSWSKSSQCQMSHPTWRAWRRYLHGLSFGMKGFAKDDCVILVKWIYGLFVEVMKYKKGIRKFEESKLCCWQCQPMPLYEEMCREYSKSSFCVYDHIWLGTLRQ